MSAQPRPIDRMSSDREPPRRAKTGPLRGARAETFATRVQVPAKWGRYPRQARFQVTNGKSVARPRRKATGLPETEAAELLT
jgi:hypothetical protein